MKLRSLLSEHPSYEYHMNALVRSNPTQNQANSMNRLNLDKKAVLTVWPANRPAHVAFEQEFTTLREAFLLASTLDANEDHPWITTENGDILSPRWIWANV